MGDGQFAPVMSIFLIGILLLMYARGVCCQCRYDSFNKVPLERTASSSEATLASQDYPHTFSSNANCQWLLSSHDDDLVVKVQIEELNLKFGQNCYSSSLAFYDGKYPTDNELAKLCKADKDSNTVTSTGQKMLVVLRTDKYTFGKSFKIRFSAVKPSSKDDPNSKIRKGGWLSTGALVGGIVGAVCFVIILGIACQRCMAGAPRPNRPHRAAAFYHAHAPPPGTTGLVTMVQNNNAIFMLQQATGGSVSPSRLAPTLSNASDTSNGGGGGAGGDGGNAAGVTNMAFNASADQLQSLREATYNILAPPIGLPPPPYVESMIVTHPPSAPPSPRRSVADISDTVPDGPAGIQSLVNSIAGPAAFSAAFGMSTPVDTPRHRRSSRSRQGDSSADPPDETISVVGPPERPTIVVDGSALTGSGSSSPRQDSSQRLGAGSSSSVSLPRLVSDDTNEPTTSAGSTSETTGTTVLPSGMRAPEIVISDSTAPADCEVSESAETLTVGSTTTSQAVQTSRAPSPQDFSAEAPLLNRAAVSIHAALSSIRSEGPAQQPRSDSDDVFCEAGPDGTLPPPPSASYPPSPTGSAPFPPPPPEALESDTQSFGAPDTDPLL
ncbi:hypothetical protein BaRGS_00001703 [Batillaria attramentaria]|uniref:CUB domain-containing protein n=1 Tax=Batillaria attramentaria TaxID=370345 RepID=A0ABD0M5D8_9CAEN